MDTEWAVFAVGSGQPERYFRRQGQASKDRGERATSPGVRTATNDVFRIARYVVQSGPHTQPAGISCQSAAALRPQGYLSVLRSTIYVISLAFFFFGKDASQPSGAIFYDPDSADDIDDDDPDEDLDI